MKTSKFSHILLTTLLLSSSLSQAGDLYVEADPFAYMLKGYSLHIGKAFGPLRAQGGVFGIDVPEGMRRNTAYDVRMDGIGFKLDYIGRSEDGWFAGTDLNRAALRYRYNGSEENHNAVQLGVRGGYRKRFGQRMFATPWIGLSRELTTPADITFAGERYEERTWTPFATLHLGMVF